VGVKYETTVIAVGEMAAEFAAEGILVFFGKDAPEELHEFAIIHDHKELRAPVVPGDVIEIGGSPFPVTAVGDVANDNIANLGHLVLKLNGLEQTELPGEVSVAEGQAPEVGPGTVIRIIGGQDDARP
jgi:PTS system glucitol/sorbitol-specific IIA component